MDNELDQALHLADIDFLSVLSAFDEGVIIADKSGRIVFYNQTQAQIDDLEPEYVIGKSVPEVYNLDQNSSLILRCIKSGRPIIKTQRIIDCTDDGDAGFQSGCEYEGGRPAASRCPQVTTMVNTRAGGWGRVEGC